MVARSVLTQLLGLLVLVVPLVAIRWDLAGRNGQLLGRAGRRSLLTPPPARVATARWRLELYSTADEMAEAVSNPADVPFPVTEVRSERAGNRHAPDDLAWTLPRVELDVEVDDPFSDESFRGLLGAEHRVRFVSGDEAVVDLGVTRLRIRAIQYE